MPFELHPWQWADAPEFPGYQGPCPVDTNVEWVFLGKDANFPRDDELERHPEAANLLHAYIADPAQFLNCHQGIHHAFRHPEWVQQLPRHSGGRYHHRFNRLLRMTIKAPIHEVLTPQRAAEFAELARSISFLELLRAPTIGNSGLCALFKSAVAGQAGDQERQLDHLKLINAVLGDDTKTVFVFKGFGGLWGSLGKARQQILVDHAPNLAALGNWLEALHETHFAQPQPQEVLASVIPHTHFSWRITNQELQGIANRLRGGLPA